MLLFRPQLSFGKHQIQDLLYMWYFTLKPISSYFFTIILHIFSKTISKITKPFNQTCNLTFHVEGEMCCHIPDGIDFDIIPPEFFTSNNGFMFNYTRIRTTFGNHLEIKYPYRSRKGKYEIEVKWMGTSVRENACYFFIFFFYHVRKILLL